MKKNSALGIVFLLLTGCLMNQSTKVSVLQAPEVGEASKYRSIAVSRFGGQYGEEIAIALESALTNAKVQEKPVYRSVTRFSPTTSLKNDSRSAAAFAKNQSTDAILLGDVTSIQVNDSPRTTSEYKCTQNKDPNKFFSPCISGYNKTVYCTDRKAVLQVQVQLIDGISGRPVYSESINKSAESSGCGDTQPDQARKMIGDLTKTVINTIMEKVVPHDKVIEITLMLPDEKIQAKDNFNMALRFAQESRLDRSCKIFNDIYENEKESPAINYNLGICEESNGSFWRAAEYYAIADRLSTEPNKLITSGLMRNSRSIKNSGALADNRKDLNLENRIEAGAAPQTISKGKGKTPSTKSSSISNKEIDRDALMLDARVALVIGNSKYKKGALLNPANDARAMTNELRAANFKVISIEDADLPKMNRAIDEFSRSIKKDGVALVFYAGHGMQVKGENYLIPIDASFNEESEISYKAINIGYILSKLEDAKSRVNVIILDACRDNPLARSWRSGKVGGLASIDAPAGTLIAYATAPGKTAADGSGANGLYTSHLLQQLRIGNQKIEDILKNTRKAVAVESNQQQIPWDSSSLTGDFYFKASK